MISTLLRKIDVRDIVAGHFKTLRDASTSKASTYDIALFYVLPMVPALALAFFKVKLTDGTIAVLATALSILAGLLFNLLVLLHTLNWEKRGDPFDSSVEELMGQLHVNIAYAIVVSLITLLPLIVGSYYGLDDLRRTIFGDIAAYLSIHFVLTMGMVLKRMDTMLQLRLSKS